jgi:hypothetical protein
MDFTTLGLTAAALILGVLYMSRRRARLSSED